jgi:hypothetical protein
MKVSVRQQHAVLNESIRSKRLRGLRLRLRIAAVLLGVMGFAFSDTAYASPAEPNPTMRVRVLNYTQATPSTVAQAEREAARIFDEAGLKTVWLDCPLGEAKDVPQDPCQEPLEANEIMVRVLSDKTRHGYQDNAFGFAVAPLLASVYYEHAERLARIDDAKFEVPIILGCVMVHEIGHLLLGQNSHSDSGIMQSRWERKQVRQIMMGALAFTGQQSKRILAEVQTQISHQSVQLRGSSQEIRLPIDNIPPKLNFYHS